MVFCFHINFHWNSCVYVCVCFDDLDLENLLSNVWISIVLLKWADCIIENIGLCQCCQCYFFVDRSDQRYFVIFSKNINRKIPNETEKTIEKMNGQERLFTFDWKWFIINWENTHYTHVFAYAFSLKQSDHWKWWEIWWKPSSNGSCHMNISIREIYFIIFGKSFPYRHIRWSYSLILCAQTVILLLIHFQWEKTKQ